MTMRKTSSIIFFILLLVILSAQPASAEVKAGGFFSVSSIFNIFLLAVAVACLIWGLQILSLVRGGLISKSWQMFILGFCFLILAQLLIVLQNIGLFAVSAIFTTILYLLMAVTWLVGLNNTRKVLG